MNKPENTSPSLAAAITQSASKQTYYTIRFLVDRDFVQDAYRAYGYFRWVDDHIDTPACLGPALGKAGDSQAAAFIHHQQELLEACYRGEPPAEVCCEEGMLVELVRNDSGENPGLQSYLRNMMAVMEFDAGRRGRLISQAELVEYSRMLATAVTDAMFYFIGHDDPAPPDEACYLAVNAAHLTHMLRDTLEDLEAGYYNIPGEYLQAHGITEREVESPAYRQWVCKRVGLARSYFKAGRGAIAQVKNLRRRLAGYAYTARFEWMLRLIERENFCLRSEYPQRKSTRTALWMGWRVLSAMLASTWIEARPEALATQSARMKSARMKSARIKKL